MTDRAAFGPTLRRARERRGLTLDQIAEQTKVSAALFAGLERNDLSRWPSGLFRRAFVRSYAQAVGLDPDEVCASFVHLFPEDGDEAAVAASAAATPPPSAEPVAARTPTDSPSPSGPASRLSRRLVAAGVDVALAAVPAALVGLAFGAQWFWVATASLGVAGHVAILGARGSTPGTAWFLRGNRRPAAPAVAAPAAKRRTEADVGASGARRIATRHPGHARPVPRGRRLQH